MVRRPTSVLSALFLCTLGLVLSGCPPEGVKIGAVLPLTGEAAVYGEAVRKGVELAYDEISADDEFQTPIELEIVDTKSDPDTAMELLDGQFKAGAMTAIGGVTSGEAKAMIEVLDRFDRVMVSPSATNPDLTGISRNFYRIIPSDHTSATKMAQSAWQVLGIKSMVVIAEAQPYAKGIQSVFVPAFEGYGGEILEVLEFPPNTSDLAALVSRAASLQSDGVYLAGYADGLASMIRELRSLKYPGKILTTSAFAAPSAIVSIGDDAAGVFLTQTVFDLDSQHAHVKSFVEGFRAKFGEEPDLYAAHGYDAMRVLAAALDGRPALPGEVKKGLRDAIDDFPGVTGSIKFDEKGEVRKFPRLYRIGQDLLLIDYNEAKKKRQEEIRRKREALERQLDQLQKKATGMGN